MFESLMVKMVEVLLWDYYLQAMFTNRKERGELLEGLVVDNKDIVIHNFPQVVKN